jgi:4-hydroxybenzoate polyprenyltransferase
MKFKMKNIFTLIRPYQYVKNLFIFLPLFFAGQITDVELLLNAFMAFVAFSFSASAIYILNDYQDIEEDRQHPEKKYRPLASGSISTIGAISLMSIFFIVGISLMTALSFQAVAILGVYITLNIGYSFHLKHIAILDVTIIAIGFVLRLFVGSAVSLIPLSMWIVIMTFLLALFMALAKRRDDVLLFLNTGKKMRKVIDGYNLQLIDAAMMIMASVVIVAYILYATSIEVVQRLQSEYLYLTALFVILGIMRYLQITFVEKESGSPSKILLKDIFMQLTILAWVFSFVWIIYL